MQYSRTDSNGNTLTFTITEKAPESPEEQWGDASRVVRIFDLNPGDFQTRMNFMCMLLGYPKRLLTAGNSLPYLTRILPMSYVDMTFTDAGSSSYGPMRAMRVFRSEPLGIPTGIDAASQASNYDRYRYWVEFQYPNCVYQSDTFVKSGSSPLNDANGTEYPDEGTALANGSIYQTRFVSKITRPYQKFRTIPFGCMAYADTINSAAFPPPPGQASGQVIVREGFPVNEVGLNIVYQWLQVPIGAVPWTAIGQTLACVNKKTFDGYPAGTLLLTAAMPRNYVWATGQWLTDVEYHVNYLPRLDLHGSGVYHGWNSAMTLLDLGEPGGSKGKQLNWYPIVDATENADPNSPPLPPYPSADFSALFRPQ